MPLSVGDKLGPYEILALIGKGGMGEVYRAHDPRLNRDVAIKVSNAEFTERFTREARTIAALNHTNICHLYDVGPNYLVMEYVEGGDLSGPLDLDDALPIFRQLIDGIEAAHEKNIVHRDLKPANIKITPEGVVKILDFGLAKAMELPRSGEGTPDNSPTLTMGMTQAGAILGTAAYMSPEQAKGKIADRRADIWSFGIVVYELLSGKKLFGGESVVEILGGVMNKEPDLSAAPPRVQKLLRWCLEKDRKHRLQAIGDARILLEEGLKGPEIVAALATAPSRSLLGSVMPWAASAILAAVAGWALWPRSAELKPLVRLDIELNPPVTATVGSGPVLSPDGSRMVYVANSRLYTRRLDQAETTEITGTEGAAAPFFSSDGQTVAFYAQGKLKKVSLAGGGVVAISGGGTGFSLGSGSWGNDGSIFSTTGVATSPLARIPAAGGKAEPLGELYREEGEGVQWAPQILPGGKLLLYTGRAISAQNDDGFSVVLSLPGLTRKIVQRNAAMARYAALPDGSGYLLYANRGTLFATPFDLERQETFGTSMPVLEGVLENGIFAGAQFDVSANGTLVYQRGSSSGGSLTLQWLDSAGKLQPLLAKPGPYGRPTVSPDGTRVALDNAGDVWTYDWQRDIMTRLTFNAGVGGTWSPDSRFILYSGNGGIGWTRSDGGAGPQTLIAAQNLLYPWSFSPGGKRLAYFEITGEGYDIYTATIENDGTTLKAGMPEPFLKTPADERYPQFSPDGRWMMYTSSESGTFQVYVRAFPDKGGKWQVSSGGATYPEWSSDGRTIFFRTLENQIMVANYTVKGDTFTAEKPRLWAEQRIAEVGLARNYGLHPDGKRIAALMPAAGRGGEVRRPGSGLQLVGMTSGGSNKKVANGLVAVSCAAVMAVYTAGYVRTRAAANQFDVQAAERRPAVQVAQVDPALSEESRPIEPIARTETPSAVRSTSVNPVRPAAPEVGVVATAEPAPFTAPVEVATVAPAPVAQAPVVTAAPVAPVKAPVAEVVPEKPPAPKWKDGTFTGWGTSRHGDIQAEVFIEDGRIVSATIAQCLTRYSCSVIDMLPPQVKQRQSAEVDYVSRATESADAFYFAVSEALSKAK